MKKAKSILFNPGNVHGNVDLHPRRANVAIDFGLYADQFCKAAYYLALKLEDSAGYNDLDACPIAFLYRHALELYFKSIILFGSDILRLQGKNISDLYKFVDSKKLFTVHQLGKLFPYVKEILANIWGPWSIDEKDIPSLQEADKIVEDLDNVDKGSFAFRYPISKDGELPESRKLMFSVVDFSDILKEFCEFLEGICSGLSEIFDNTCEYLCNQQDCY